MVSYQFTNGITKIIKKLQIADIFFQIADMVIILYKKSRLFLYLISTK